MEDSQMKVISVLAISMLFAPGVALAQSSTSVLFVGNSFTYGAGSPARFYRADSVTDLNNAGIGGVPALFKAFTAQAGLDYDVYVETQPGSGLDFHIENRLGLIGRRPWDKVVMHGQSTLDFEKPGDPAKLIATSRQLSDTFQARNPSVQVYLMATWSRADETYRPEGNWADKPIEAMALDVRAASDKAAADAPAITSVIPVGEAWTRAMRTGVADPNPYDGIAFEKVDLWTHDHYHASVYGYYLEALTVFGSLTGLDPRSLGDHECAAFELGMSRRQIHALQQVAFDQLLAENAVTPAPLLLPKPAALGRCVHGR
jgi:hypothetical protein